MQLLVLKDTEILLKVKDLLPISIILQHFQKVSWFGFKHKAKRDLHKIIENPKMLRWAKPAATFLGFRWIIFPWELPKNQNK